MFETQTQAAQSAVNDLAQAAEQKVSDQQNALDTAALQYQNDQQAIAGLQVKITAANSILASDADMIGKQAVQIQQAQMQLLQLQSTVTYPDLEWGQFSLNLKPDAASGRGDGSFTLADTGKPAVFSIVPAAPLAGQTDNYFNIYATQKKKPNAAYTNFLLTGKFEFPTDADMKAAHCIEMEVRQVLKLVAPATLPLMSVPACQLNFTGNQFRYFNALAPGDNWIATGIPMPRQRSIAIVMEAHRDDKTFYYDAFTINGTRQAVSFSAPLYAKTYVNERLSVSLQLDSHYLAGPFKVNVSGVSLKVW